MPNFLNKALSSKKAQSCCNVAAGLAAESVTHYGDNGLPDEAAEVLAAAESAGPIPFEAPYKFRRRMRDVTEWMKEHGRLPDAP